MVPSPNTRRGKHTSFTSLSLLYFIYLFAFLFICLYLLETGSQVTLAGLELPASKLPFLLLALPEC